MNNHPTLPGIDVSCHFVMVWRTAVAGLGGVWTYDAMVVLWGCYFWTCNKQYITVQSLRVSLDTLAPQ